MAAIQEGREAFEVRPLRQAGVSLAGLFVLIPLAIAMDFPSPWWVDVVRVVIYLGIVWFAVSLLSVPREYRKARRLRRVLDEGPTRPMLMLLGTVTVQAPWAYGLMPVPVHAALLWPLGTTPRTSPPSLCVHVLPSGFDDRLEGTVQEVELIGPDRPGEWVLIRTAHGSLWPAGNKTMSPSSRADLVWRIPPETEPEEQPLRRRGRHRKVSS